ncbi:uncharacterized protein Bfra_011605 [Botrytis fragariae]|uniref:Uncharacterized protein n=1 Tax=Botrytis fragariae TaxID=1964551 RepID=A0A8H6AJU4_9HELO|nr:uncharacterized protein Bfra_011605 [Botrytis fragariae]KAF5869063.1 hypothetical protein Bfra_011605 [Botrytis fragariae]
MLQDLRFPIPESHDAIDLVKLVSDNIDRHIYESRTALGIKEIALECLTKGCNYSTHSYFSEKAYNPSDHPENLSLSYLFAVFNDLFFLGILPSRTTVSRSTKATDPNCASSSCLQNIVIRGKMSRGQAWQIIAYNLEISDTIRAMRKAVGMEVSLRKMDELEWELSHWKLTELEQLEQWVYRHSSGTWAQALKCQLRCLKAAQDRIIYDTANSTKIVRRNDNDLSLTPELSIPFRAASSLRNFAATTRIIHDPIRKIDRTKAPYIMLPSEVLPLPTAALETICLNNITACGKAYRGQAWQKIANTLEKSEIMRDMQTLIGSQVRLRRYEEFVRELSYWDIPRLLVSSDLIRELGLVAWTVKDFVYAAEEERGKRIAPEVRRS